MHNINQITIKFYNTMLEKAEKYVYTYCVKHNEWPTLRRFCKRFKVNTVEALQIVRHSRYLTCETIYSRESYIRHT